MPAGVIFDNLVFGLHDSGNSGDSIHIIIGSLRAAKAVADTKSGKRHNGIS